MNRLLIIALVVLLSCIAHAGGNPDVRAYIDFDPPNYVHELAPAPYSMVYAYLCLDHLDNGMTAVSFRTTDLVQECPGVFGTQSYMTLLPGGIPFTITPWIPPGTTLSSTECMGVSDPVVVVGYVQAFYLGGSCCYELRDHLDYPRWVVDCEDGVDFYCVHMHGSIGGYPCPDGDCAPVPVECETWGTIKSLYR